MDNATGIGELDLRIMPQALTSLTEAAAVIDRSGQLIFANALFSMEMGLVEASGAAVAEPVLIALGLVEGGRARRNLQLKGRDGVRNVDLLAFPLATEDRVLVLAIDRTVDVALRDALAGSRARFKDLVEVSSDCAWETAADGSFSMVGPKGLAGVGSRALIGGRPSQLLDPVAPQPAISPFATPVPVSAVEVWMRHVDGRLLCFEVSAVPLYDDRGEWRGARGVCRDVTARHEHEGYLAEQRMRERIFARITGVFRREADPDDMLQVAASTSTHGFAASGCHILTAMAGSAIPGARPLLTVTAAFGKTGDDHTLRPIVERLIEQKAEEVQLVVAGPWSVLIAPAVYGGRLVGAVLLWRSSERPAWTAGDIQLLGAIAGQIAAAIEQRAQFRLLFEASRTDSLTGLLNRRGFYDEMKRRFKRLQRDTRAAALVYLDLDNFKLVNDVYGHAKGDEALRHLAEILKRNTRSTDLVARLGGDEFAVWLENAEDAVAINRAQTFLAAAGVLLPYSGRADRPLHVSIGIAVYHPTSREDINQFITRADSAMYAVKRSGKGHYALAPAPDPSP